MKFAWNVAITAWRVTGLIGEGGKWFAGFSCARDLPEWQMPNAPELFRMINSTPLLQSLLYDLNLLPECITDPVRWAYMITVCEHMTAALARGAKDQRA